MTTSTFDLPDHLAAKADPALVADDERFFARLAASLEHAVAELSERLDAARRAPAGGGQQALERDQEVRRLTARLRLLRRYDLDLCLGRMVPADGSPPVHVGRIGLSDRDGRRLLVDWRSPAAEPFFGATHADPMGLSSRRRYRWTGGRVTDYWDEVLTPDGLDGHAALDDQSAFVASLGTHRSARMRDVLATISADQHAVIRAGSEGTLVVDGGPGTGKTVVALHRAAYLLHSDPHVAGRRGGVLVVGPHEPYLAYVADVLPSLGEEGVRTCTLRELVPEGAVAVPEADPEVARLKSTTAMVEAIEPAVRFYERPPAEPTTITTPWADVELGPTDWAEAFAAPDPGTPHNEAQPVVLDALVEVVVDAHPDDVPRDAVRAALRRDGDLARAVARAWPVIEPTDLVGDLWTVPAYLRMCAPHLDRAAVDRLQRARPDAWTVADLPLLDAARRRLGDPAAPARRRREEAALAAERDRRADVVDHLVATDDSEMQVMSMLRGDDLQQAFLGDVAPTVTGDPLAGPFAHVVVDEAQELTDAEWQMLLARCPSRSLTVAGDRAQARHGFTEPWQDRLERVGLARVTHSTLRVNYRTPEEVMREAEPVIRAVLPDANVPTSVRSTGVPVVRGHVSELDGLLDTWLAEHPEGTACVVGAPAPTDHPRVRSLPPELVKGLEFDVVVVVGPQTPDGVTATVDRYVAMTRATQRLAVLTP